MILGKIMIQPGNNDLIDLGYIESERLEGVDHKRLMEELGLSREV